VRAAALVLLVAAGPATAGPGVPGAGWFAGVYDRVGRDAEGRPVNDRVRITGQGDWLTVEACGAPPWALRFQPFSLRENGLGSADGTLSCLFHTDAGVRPLLTCEGEGLLRLTLWNTGPGFRAEALDCGG
jgi:hypothetical protein